MQTLSIRAFDGAPPDAAPPVAASAPPAVTVRRHLDGLYRFARGLGADPELAADLCQEAFLIAWRKGGAALPDPALGAFLRRSARFLWLQHNRRERRREAAIAAAAERLWDDEGDRRDERLHALRACVQRLRGRPAVAVQLCYGESQGRDAIAAALGLSPNGVKTLLARTRRWLAECVGRQS